MQIPFVGPTYNGRSNSVNSSKSVNFYVEVNKEQDSVSPVSLVGTPGTLLWKRLGDNPIRQMYKFGDFLFVATGNKFYRVTSTGVVTEVGSLNTNSGFIRISDNGVAARGVGGNQLLIIDGTYGYIYDYLSNTIITHPSSNFPVPVKAVSYMDGYFIVSSGNMGITVSELYDATTFNGLAVAAAISTPDNISNIVNLHQQLFLIKEYSTEVWYNAGIATQDGCPFARVNGAVIDYGTTSPYSVARGNNSLFFLGNARLGSGSSAFCGIVELQGYTPTVISTPAITYAMSKFQDKHLAEAYCYTDEGHTFYVITFPVSNVTYAYDTSSQMWHERSTYSKKDEVTFGVDGKPTIKHELPNTQNRHLSSCYVNFAGKHLVGDYRTGNIYEMNSSYYSDNGEPIVSIRTSPLVMDNNDNKEIFTSRLTVNAESGVGDSSVFSDENFVGYLADGSITADGTYYAGSLNFVLSTEGDPEAYLSWSNDSGNTWSSEYPASLGKEGEYNTRMVWRRLGKARNRVYRLRISSSVKKVISSATVEASL